jgi:hypothetical protein
MLGFDCGPSVPPKNSVGPDALGVPGPCFAARETSENLQMISQRRKRLAFAPAASDVRFSDCVKRTSALALERRPRCDPSHAGVMPYCRAESWLPRLSATPYPSARRLRRLDSLALCCGDVGHSRPNTASVKLNSFAGPIYAQTRRARPEKRVCQRRWRLAFLSPLRSQACSEARQRGCLVRALVDLRRQRGPWHSYGVSRNSVPPRPRRNERPVRSWAWSRLAPIGS